MNSSFFSNANGLTAAEAMVRIRMAMQQRDLAGALSYAEAGRRQHPNDAALADTAGDLALKSGDARSAVEHFEAASKLAPDNLDYILNQAIALQRLGRDTDVIILLEKHEKRGRKVAKYCSIRALSHRSLGAPAKAAQWYDAVLAIEPRHPRALHGRARIALERGEPDALARFDAALAINRGDADLWLGKAQALDVAGDIAGARRVAEQLCDQAPGFIAALTFLSGLKLANGEDDFAAPFRAAATKAPQDPNIAATHIETLAGLDHSEKAAQVAGEARVRFPNEAHFTLQEAIQLGAAGDWQGAERAFAQLPPETPNRAVHEARHRLRAHQLSQANALLDRALADNPWDISIWATRGIAWRLGQDEHSRERAAWLHEQKGLVQFVPLAGRSGLIDDVTGELQSLHQGSAMPLGQSLRGGTQTRGILFHRTEPLLAELADAILATLNDYRSQLPAADPTHPLLRLRDAPWRLAGSWSVRLTGGGDYHSAHIHQLGVISSALYLVVPDEVEGPEQRGWLELGRPKPDLGLSLPPFRTIKPKIGHLALFPSTAYHGTAPFSSAERMTVAFDVVS